MSQIAAPLVELLAADFDPSDHFVVHPCGHWVVKRLLGCEGRGGGEGGIMEDGGEEGKEREMEIGDKRAEKEEESEHEEDEERGEKDKKGGREEGESFAEMILGRVSDDDIRAWTATNRGAFVTLRYAYNYFLQPYIL